MSKFFEFCCLSLLTFIVFMGLCGVMSIWWTDINWDIMLFGALGSGLGTGYFNVYIFKI